MWGNSINSDAIRQHELQPIRSHPHHQDSYQPGEADAQPGATTSAGQDGVEGQGSGARTPAPVAEGTWGERDTGDVTEQEALREYESLRQDLLQLHKTRTTDTQASKAKSQKSKKSLRRGALAHAASKAEKDTEAGDVESNREDAEAEEGSEDEFELGDFMREGHFEKRTEQGSAKRVGVIYENLTVKGVGSTAAFVKTVPQAVMGTFGPDLYRILSSYIPAIRFRSPPTRTLINDFTGCVRDGEMMLVLGRPGAGCSTFLKAVSNNRESYASVEGTVTYGGIDAAKQKKQYRGEVNYNGEDDIHFASLNVFQTLKFALLNKTKKSNKDDIPVIVNALMRMFGIGHTAGTVVGDAFVRGVSGGERKRVSIAETLASKSTVITWDNSTRGLDASTALDYARSLRIMTDISNRTTLVTLYQAGEGIYETFDKVLLIDQGRQIFSGPANKAKQYFTDLGFECPDRQTTADFLTAVTDPNERRIRSGFEDRVPRSPEELETAFRNSQSYKEVLADVEDYRSHLHRTDHKDDKDFETAVQESKSKHVSDDSSYTVSFFRQVMACFIREFWLLLGDRTTLYTKFFIIIANGLIVGSLFYGQPSTTAGAFAKGGAVFFSAVFLGWLQLSELMKAVSGRSVVSRHRDYAFYRPSAVSLGRVLLDFPFIAIQVCVFGVIMYFMTGLDVDVSKFWIYLLFIYTTTIMVTALYRMFASLSPEIDTAVRFSGLGLNLLIVFTGYVIAKPVLLDQKIWFGWLYYINPLSYSFEAMLSNEFAGRTLDCDPSQIVPQGPGVQEGYQGCAFTGAPPNSLKISGEQYLSSNYDYSRSNLWPNFGTVIAFGVLYILVTVLASEFVSFAGAAGGALVFKKTRSAKKEQIAAATAPDEEKATKEVQSSGETSPVRNEEEVLDQITESTSIFTWKDVEYTVPYLGGERKLLNKVSGYAKPGKMVALMGASGAGKTTLLNTLSQRQSVGVVTGEMQVDGRALSSDFQRNCGFALQQDIHDSSSTCREALEFSAILRQAASIPRAEKIEYVDKIVDLLELNNLQDAIISSLDVEQRKRLTIGVELAAKPSLLLFLDEPTSGLDSQSAYSVVRFLKKLTQAGQAIICTIHQPSSVLIQQFDMVLALNPGGNTFYFGPMGENGQDVVNYFADRGAVCPPTKNIAEFILETAARPFKRQDGTKIDWNEEWRTSPEAQDVLDEIDGLKRVRSQATDGQEHKKGSEREFAASTFVQTTELLRRLFRQYWRDSSYIYGKLFVAVLNAILNGFTYWNLGNSTTDLQNRVFSCFLIVMITPSVINGVMPKYFSNMAIWQAREYPSRIYGWVAFCTANILVELPAAIVCGVLYWILWFWPSGLSTDSAVAGYSFLMVIFAFIFFTSWGQWICSFAPSYAVISNVLPFFLVFQGLMNGVVVPYDSMPVIWRYFAYYANPVQYYVSGLVGFTLTGVQIRCQDGEAAVFDAPPNMTCGDYAGAFADSSPGYLINPDDTSSCQYCPYSVGDDYLATLNIDPSFSWQDLGIFIAFCVSNVFMVYFFIYTVRIKGWSFGLGYVFGGAEKVIGKVKGMFSRKGRT